MKNYTSYDDSFYKTDEEKEWAIKLNEVLNASPNTITIPGIRLFKKETRETLDLIPVFEDL